jgi:hypothetical protein
VEYIGIDIAMGSLASLADGFLLIYLKNTSPVHVKHTGFFGNIAMLVAIVLYFLISSATKGTQIWSLMVQIGAGIGNGDSDSSDDYTAESLQIYQDVDTAASGMLLLFSIGFALLSINFLSHLSKTHPLRKRLSWAVTILAASFLVRNIVIFVFTLIYAQYGQVASLIIQLIYMAFYGLLSVVVYACIVSIAAAQEKEDPWVDEPRYGQVAQTVVNEEGVNWQQERLLPKVMTDLYLKLDSYDPLRYENWNPRRF